MKGGPAASPSGYFVWSPPPPGTLSVTVFLLTVCRFVCVTMSLLTVCAFVCVVGSLLIVFTVCVLVWIGDIMGETETTPLSLMLSHFSDVRKRARILSIDIQRKRFQIYCISEWPTFGVGWPQEGTFHLPIILQVKTVILRDKPDGHSDQVSYILAWQDMIENPPPRLKPFLPPKAGPTEILALMNRTSKETLTKLAPETGRDWVTLLPFALYRVRTSPYKMGLTPYKIMFGLLPPIIPNLKPEVLAEFDDHQLLFSLQMLQQTHEQVWPNLRALYETGPPPDPY
ncbi:unnamed protein product [Nyctereutes procyonoides]|uniref:(raccoon dog) hypothetical protein n=1 Tax=Nyctereutes procyonoides TaxID=34880 RepID=A0A811YYY2_NYCPR|nr:unnamed protein product [Nyctereutes procyonoides]